MYGMRGKLERIGVEVEGLRVCWKGGGLLVAVAYTGDERERP
jgi:hypothetical protein